MLDFCWSPDFLTQIFRTSIPEQFILKSPPPGITSVCQSADHGSKLFIFRNILSDHKIKGNSNPWLEEKGTDIDWTLCFKMIKPKWCGFKATEDEERIAKRDNDYCSLSPSLQMKTSEGHLASLLWKLLIRLFFWAYSHSFLHNSWYLFFYFVLYSSLPLKISKLA